MPINFMHSILVTYRLAVIEILIFYFLQYLSVLPLFIFRLCLLSSNTHLELIFKDTSNFNHC